MYRPLHTSKSFRNMRTIKLNRSAHPPSPFMNPNSITSQILSALTKRLSFSSSQGSSSSSESSDALPRFRFRVNMKTLSNLAARGSATSRIRDRRWDACVRKSVFVVLGWTSIVTSKAICCGGGIMYFEFGAWAARWDVNNGRDEESGNQ